MDSWAKDAHQRTCEDIAWAKAVRKLALWAVLAWAVIGGLIWWAVR